jgi:hypothetical protein
MANIVTIENIGTTAPLMQFLLQGMSQGGFTGPGQAGKPQQLSSVPVLFFTPFTGNRRFMPDNVFSHHNHSSI